MKKIRIIEHSIIFLLLLLLASISPVFADIDFDDPVLTINTDDYYLTAGIENTIRISITNVGKRNAYDVEAHLMVPATLSGFSIIDGSYQVIEKIGDRQTATIETTVFAANGIILGAYSLNLDLKWYSADQEENWTKNIAVGFVVDATTSNDPILIVSTSQYNLTSNKRNVINISITNIGERYAFDIESALKVPSTIQGISIVENNYEIHENLGDQQTITLEPTLAVAKSCPLGAYSLTLNLKWYSAGHEQEWSKEFRVGVYVDSILTKNYSFKATVKGYKVKAGSENLITITLRNTGNAKVLNVDARISSSNPNIVILKNMTNIFSLIEQNSTVQLTPIILISRNTPLGSHSIILTLAFKDSNGIMYSDSMVIGLFVYSIEPIDQAIIVIPSFRIIPIEVHQGEKFTLEMKIENLGKNAHNVQARLSIGNQIPIFPQSPSVIFIGDLESNQSTNISYKLQISGDASAQLYTIQVIITYEDQYNTPKSLSENISVEVYSIINFRLLNIESTSLAVNRGEIGNLEADLLLIGTEPVDFVQIEILNNITDSPFTTIPESYEYIGRVDPDSPIPFDIQFMVDSDAEPGEDILHLKVSCWNEYNQEKQALIDLTTTINESTQNIEEVRLTFWDMIWNTIRSIFGIKP